MEWEEQLWTHTSMVMVGTSNHSDAVMCRATSQEGKEAAMNDTHHHHHHQPFPISLLFYLSSAVITALTTTIDGTAAITPGRHQPQSGVRQTLHISVALMKSVEEAHEAVEPTTMMKVRGPCIPSPSNRPSKAAERASKGHGVARGRLFSPFPPPATTATTTADDVWLHLDALALCLSSISTCSSSSLVTNSSDCDRGCGGCDVRRCAVASRDDAAGGGQWPISSQALMTRPGRYTHTQMCQRRRHEADVCGFPQPISFFLFPTNRHCSVSSSSSAFPMRCAAVEA
ncbi:hypothetical protein PTSG_13164 [Salpingoeca rosetta]|uniref:Uncharacterized protein n=1 Tax=Salpingoeca rosetta (strain ATCC 50818 / BSB-021) TaxID=946362 RepID=F2USY7_SALR5|nr:uncharacterized protein PTSG_13164 [Salpingoeca rosetta]EGD81247.1 hypothetical protein PTSG_13164 [Salpingoeca rosetta]|eukprot:XP_004987781.1 hypothetical protein PTSG_13164 [Salpingoeca rosetta]